MTYTYSPTNPLTKKSGLVANANALVQPINLAPAPATVIKTAPILVWNCLPTRNDILLKKASAHLCTASTRYVFAARAGPAKDTIRIVAKWLKYPY